MELLDNIVWSFNDTDYPTQEIFSQAVMEYQLRIMLDRAQWHPGEVVVESPVVEIIYEYWSTGNETVFEDETPLDEEYEEEEHEEEDDDEEEDFDEDDTDNEDEKDQLEVKARFTADNGQNFTAGELLYKLHQRLRHRELGDHIFFEGLHAFGESERKQPPVFYLYCGS